MAQIEDLIHELGAIRADLIDLERREAVRVSGMPESHQASTRNLLHYLALRRHDIRAWGRMVAHLRRAEQDIGKPCRILMDLAGPKLRTGPIETGARVLNLIGYSFVREPSGIVELRSHLERLGGEGLS